MSSLPAKPEFSRTASAWPEPGDERRPSGPGRASPDRYAHQRDDRDRDRDPRDRDRDRGNRSRYTHSGQRSPPPPRSTDTYIAGSRDTYHGREYRAYDDARSRDDRRKDWDRDRDRDRDRDIDRDRDRDRAYYRRQMVDDRWSPRKDYSSNGTSNRRGYGPRESDWRGRDDYRREIDRGRERERGRSRDRDDQRPREHEHDRRPPSPTYHPAPLSPRRGESTATRIDARLHNAILDHHRELHSPLRRAPPSYPSRGRSTSPRSIGNRSRRSSPLSRARPESVYTHPPRDSPQPPKSPSRRGSPSPNRHPRTVSSPTRERQSPETAGRQLHPDEPYREVESSGSEPVQVEDRPVEGAIALDGEMDAKGTTESLTKGKDRSDNRGGELHGKAESLGLPGPPMECQQELIPTVETVVMPSSEVAVTQPYLPTIPRYEAKPRFSVAYESEASLFELVALINSSRYHLFLV